MEKSSGNSKGRINMASCIAATSFLTFIFLTVALVIILLFRPQAPSIHVASVRFPSFFFNSTASTVHFVFAVRASVRNPNRSSFSHYDSKIEVVYCKGVVGFMYVPAGDIGGGMIEYMDARFDVPGFQAITDVGNDGVLEFKLVLDLKGRVRLFAYFMHPLVVTHKCWLRVGIPNADVIFLSCHQ